MVIKKVTISLCVTIMILLVGCSNNKDKIPVINTEFDKIKSELSLFPKEYKADNAIKDGCFVIVHGVLKSKENIMDEFISKSRSGKPSSITIVQYTDEGDALITKVLYNNNKYYGVEDDTRDDFASPENRKYWEFEYKYLKAFVENDSTGYYLVNDDNLTIDDIRKSLLSSQSFDHIEHQYLCIYLNY